MRLVRLKLPLILSRCGSRPDHVNMLYPDMITRKLEQLLEPVWTPIHCQELDVNTRS